MLPAGPVQEVRQSPDQLLVSDLNTETRENLWGGEPLWFWWTVKIETPPPHCRDDSDDDDDDDDDAHHLRHGPVPWVGPPLSWHLIRHIERLISWTCRDLIHFLLSCELRYTTHTHTHTASWTFIKHKIFYRNISSEPQLMINFPVDWSLITVLIHWLVWFVNSFLTVDVSSSMSQIFNQTTF